MTSVLDVAGIVLNICLLWKLWSDYHDEKEFRRLIGGCERPWCFYLPFCRCSRKQQKADKTICANKAKKAKTMAKMGKWHQSWRDIADEIEQMPANSAQQIAQKISAKKDLKFVMDDSDVTRSVQDNLAKIQQVNR